MIPLGLLNVNVTIIRRTSQGRDSLNNPVYGTPTSGVGWNLIYYSMPVKLAFSSKMIQFAKEGERIQPSGVAYYNNGYQLQQEDRVVTSDGIEYTVTSVVPAYVFNQVIDHYEALLQLS